MLYRLSFYSLLILALMGSCPIAGWAQMFGPDEKSSLDEALSQEGFAKPYEYERQAYGYDPEGVEYHENQSEDFQVIFITSAPFAAGASFLITGMVSLANNGNFQVGGDYFMPFLGLTFVGTTTIACVSVLTNKYPPPGEVTSLPGLPASRSFAFNIPLVTAKF